MIGYSYPREDALEKVKGIAKYNSDFYPNDALWLRPVLSPVSHGILHSINIKKAMSLPGVLDVLSAKDFPGQKIRGAQIQDNPILPIDRVNYKGEIVALVVAESLQAAEEATKAIELDITELPALLTVEQALSSEASRIHLDHDNLVRHMHLVKGNFQDAVCQADLILDKHFTTPRVEHCYIEPDSAWAQWQDDKLCVYSEIQDGHYLVHWLSLLLDLPKNSIRVIKTEIGGAFGGKTDFYLEPYVALATLKYKRPSIMRLTRKESFLVTYKRQPTETQYTVAFKKDGTILGIKANILCDNGAYSFSSPAVCKRMVTHGAGCYQVENVDIELSLVYTNNTPTSSMRGYGTPQINFPIESHLDEAARQLGIDKLEIRRRNALKKGSYTITGQQLKQSVGLTACIDAVAHWRAEHPQPLPPTGWHAGCGIGCMYYGIGKTGVIDPASVRLVYQNNKLEIFSSVSELGQGCRQALRQIASASLSLPLENIKLIENDTDFCPNAGITSASRITYTAGRAVQDACNILDEQLQQNAPQPIEVKYTFSPHKTVLDSETWQGAPYPEYAFAAQMAEVEINDFTGEVRLKRIIAAHDVGKAINPQMVIGQIQGGAIMGAGYALSEKYVEGRTLSFHDYIIPTALDAPEVIPILIEDEASSGPFGAKGVGEPALVATASAVVNAINDAAGVWITQLPATSEAVYFATHNNLKGNDKNGD